MAAFAQSNEGDVSPNILGAHCINTGLPCDPVHSTCNGKVGGVCERGRVCVEGGGMWCMEGWVG